MGRRCLVIAIALAALLDSAPAATAAWHATAAIESAHQARVERAEKTARLAAWLNAMDGTRIRALAVYSPFADDEPDASPFEGGL
jgi:hypothetical protein